MSHWRAAYPEALADGVLSSIAGRSTGSFRIAARRADKRFPIPSPDIERIIGRQVQNATGWTVNLSKPELVIRIEDQGEGFIPEEVADPLAPENILKSSGRGIFLIRNFMDETVLKKVPGGMEIRMVKKLKAE